MTTPMRTGRVRQVTSVILDTGPLVALLNRRERHHAWTSKVMDTIEPPIFTRDSVRS